ncbi:MAG: hypothetical protein E7400_06720 [Ruminococcaceae bacterium]|nr:hypothetical protein [Oscillospiraceae bacterium]
MSYKVNFLDNQSVTAEALNSALEALGEGVLAFSDDMTYGVDDLNAISESLIGKGVSRGCDLSVSDEGVLIGPGVLFMADGKRVEINSDGVLLSYTVGKKHYVWFSHDKEIGFVAPRCTVSEPAGEDYVVLGTVEANGTISGHTDLAVMKNSHLGLNYCEEHTSAVLMWGAASEEELVKEIQPENVGVRYAIVITDQETGSSRRNLFCGYVDLKTGKSFGVHETTPGSVSTLDWGVSYGSETEGKLQIGFGSDVGIVYNVYLRFELGSDNIIRIYRSSERARATDGYNLPEYQRLRIILC